MYGSCVLLLVAILACLALLQPTVLFCPLLFRFAKHMQFVGSTHNLVTASHDGTARVWDAWTGDCLATLIGHSGRLNSVSTSSDGRTIVTCSDDQTARVWETCDYTCIGYVSVPTGGSRLSSCGHGPVFCVS